MRILIVDDNFTIRNFMKSCLEALGFNDFTEAENGAIALSIAKKQLPDIITLDWNMPLMDGYEFLQALRALPGGDEPVVVFCSTERGKENIAKVLKAGANTYITKPFNLEILQREFKKLNLI